MQMAVSRGGRLALLLGVGLSAAACGLLDTAEGTADDGDAPARPEAPSLESLRGYCTTSLDCQPGHRCVDSRCLQTCSEGELCPDGNLCRNGLCGWEDCGGEGPCEPYDPCRPGTRWCDVQGPMVCASDGTALPAQPCEPSFYCLEGECVPVACDASNPAVCDGEHIVVCSLPEQLVSAVIPCGSEGTFECRGGACVPRKCSPSERRCAERTVFQCGPDGQSWRPVDSCDALEICEVDRCLAAGTCQPGERRCDGETVVGCNDSRVGYHVVEACDGYCDGGTCHEAVCPAAATWCTGNVAFACDARGRSLSRHDCGPDAVCSSGHCKPRLCESGQTRCDSRLRLRCNPSGTGWELDACAGHDICLAGECMPEGTQLEDGLACDFDEDCLSGACLRGPSFPRGYCSATGCGGDWACAGGGLCIADGGIPYCARSCQGDSDCRSGYGCYETSRAPVCRAVVEPGPFGAEFPFFTDCGSRLLQASYFLNGDGLRQFTLTSTRGQTGFFVGLYHLGGHSARAWSLIGPDNVGRGLAAASPIYDSNTQLRAGVVGLLLPSAPTHADYVREATSHRLTLSSPDDLLCAYVIPTRAEGTRLDVNLIGVGIDGFESGLEEGTPLADMVAEVGAILAANGLELSQVRLVTAAPAVAQELQVLRSHDDLQRLLATSEAPGPTIDERLSVNVFLVRDMVFSSGSVVGASGGMPGMAGLHGFPSTGVAVSAANLERDPAATAQVAAHELGHFLGLAHTTEVTGTTIEPIDDTPTCGYLITLAAEFCPDVGNLMYPYALPTARYLSEGQRWVLRMSPLTKR
jgi:hypothetical protein